MSTTTATMPSLDMLEHIFQRLEAESSERARLEEELEQSKWEHQLLLQQEASNTLPTTVPVPCDPVTVKAVKERRRGSVSISRFGFPPETSSIAHTPTSESRTHSNRPSRSSSIVLTKSTFYQLNTARYHSPRASVVNDSHDSLASLNSSQDPSADLEDEPRVTQSITIAPKQSLSKAISRRLSRARDTSSGVPSALVIGVAVEEATVEHHSEDHESLNSPVLTSTVISAGSVSLKSKKSLSRLSSGDGDDSSSTKAWIEKAKDFTTRFRRRSLAALNSAMN